MRALGIILWGGGGLLFLFATFIFSPGVETPAYGEYGALGTSLPRTVVNLDLQQRQLLLAAAGLALFVSGIFVHTAAEVIGRFDSSESREYRAPPVGPVTAPTSIDEASRDVSLEDSMSEEFLMQRYAIEFDRDAYVWKGRRYRTFEEALATARSFSAA